MLVVSSQLVEIRTVMYAHGNLTASYLWQPGEFARRMLGERPSPVPPTRELWPLPHRPISISTLHVAYTQDGDHQKRCSTLPPQPYQSTTLPIERDSHLLRPRVCTVGTNTDPPPTILFKVRKLLKKQDDSPTRHLPPGRLMAVPSEAVVKREEENAARRALNGIKKAISGAKNRIAPDSEAVESPKIVYDISKPGDRMTTTFGAKEQRRWCKVPTRESCERRLRAVGGWCAPRSRRLVRRQSHPPPRLQITQV